MAALGPVHFAASGGDPEVTAIVCDSRQAGPGSLFVAIPGVSVDGHRFLDAAVARGALAAVVERREALPEGLPAAIVPDARAALARLAAAWHGYPAYRLRVIGITGTEGKTTSVELTLAILKAAGLPSGMVSTVSACVAGRRVETGLHTTTPDALQVQAFLAQMAEQGARYAVMEATSHGLAQKRVEACEFDVAALTNITHDHIDYHGSYEAYRDAKAQLFTSLQTSMRKPGTPKVAILNVDDPAYSVLRAIPADLHLTYGFQASADLTLTAIAPQETGWRCRAETPRGSFELYTPLLGRFNLSNILVATAIAISQDIPTEAIQAALAGFTGVEGRMEEVDLGQGFRAIVDFAHTPNALAHSLTAARELVSGRVIAVFGCPGLRDTLKRTMMGRISGQLADYTVITADDPRTESLEAIMDQIAEGCRSVGGRETEHFARVPDRAEAIAYAVSLARPGDLVLVAGKGHERSLCLGTDERPWSDREALRSALAAGLMETALLAPEQPKGVRQGRSDSSPA